MPKDCLPTDSRKVGEPRTDTGYHPPIPLSALSVQGRVSLQTSEAARQRGSLAARLRGARGCEKVPGIMARWSRLFVSFLALVKTLREFSGARWSRLFVSFLVSRRSYQATLRDSNSRPPTRVCRGSLLRCPGPAVRFVLRWSGKIPGTQPCGQGRRWMAISCPFWRTGINHGRWDSTWEMTTWCSSGAVLVQFWCNSGAVLVQFWCSSGAGH